MITIKTASAAALKASSDPVLLFVHEGPSFPSTALLDGPARRELSAAAESEKFQGKRGEVAAVRAIGRKVYLAGLGGKKGLSREDVMNAAGAACRAARCKETMLWAVPPADAEGAALGLALASYEFTLYKKSDPVPTLAEVRLAFDRAGDKARLEKAASRAALFAEAICRARDLVNRGPSDKSPAVMAREAGSQAGGRVSLSVIDRAAAKKKGLTGLLAVGRGSHEPPCLVHFVYKPAKKTTKRIGLVGKGVTFDSGGLSLKPAASMDTMKCDMAGAASVYGVFQVIERLGVKAEVHGFAPLTFNMPGPDAVKPGDVIEYMNGRTVEILNTDAEGRLILADALCLAAGEKLDAIVDLATLTGACAIALGPSVTGAMTNDRALLAKLLAASKRAGEWVWELPLVPSYNELIKSKIADIRNVGTTREGGAITAGLFLQNFVDGRPWVHLDIAAPAFNPNGGPTCPPGGTGHIVSTLLEYLSAL